jgi:hypothetical protein
MRDEDILLHINPFHLELIRPLIKWKILSIKECFEDSSYPSSYKSFHKIIQRLEKNGVIGSFKDVWTKTRRIYLTRLGNEMVNPFDWMAHAFNKQNLFHDSRVTLYLRFLAKHLPVSHVVLEQEKMKIRRKEDFQKIRPDAEFTLTSPNRSVDFILEVELTQKNKDRAWEKMMNYKDISEYRSVIFLFPNPTIYESYLRIFEMNKKEIGKHNYIFLLDQGIITGNPDLDSKVFYRDKESSIRNLFQEIIGELDRDYEANLSRLWRKSFEKLF